MLTPFDDFPIHPSGDPIAHPATGDPNHYDRYWFNGTDKDAAFYFGAAMGHYPVRDVIDAAFSVILDGVEHSIFASGRMPWDRATAIGPIRIEVVEPMRVIRYVVADNDQGITADLTFRAKTVAIEEPRQTRVRDGILFMDNTRLTQWGSWEGSITVDGRVLEVHADTTPGTRDRSWGTRPVGEPFVTNRPPSLPEVFWLWAPLHFDDMCTHLALHETSDGNRWVEQGLLVPLLDTPDSPTCGVHPAVHLRGVRRLHDLNRRDPRDGEGRADLADISLTLVLVDVVGDALRAVRVARLETNERAARWVEGRQAGDVPRDLRAIALVVRGRCPAERVGRGRHVGVRAEVPVVLVDRLRAESRRP